MKKRPILNCDKKKAYKSAKVANAAIDRVNCTSIRDKKPCRSYLCEICNMWHVTSHPDTFHEYEPDQIGENTIKNRLNRLLKRNKI